MLEQLPTGRLSTTCTEQLLRWKAKQQQNRRIRNTTSVFSFCGKLPRSLERKTPTLFFMLLASLVVDFVAFGSVNSRMKYDKVYVDTSFRFANCVSEL